jgi:hypothetical protein
MARPGAVAFKTKNEIVAASEVAGIARSSKGEVHAEAGVGKVPGWLPHQTQTRSEVRGPRHKQRHFLPHKVSAFSMVVAR